MTISAPRRDENGKLSEFDERTLCAWTAYRESLRDLSGRDYDEAEDQSWAHLQGKLHQLEEERAALGGRAEEPRLRH